MPLTYQTYELFNLLTAATKKKVAAGHGCCLKTVEAWGRMPASDKFPSGSGKANVLDAALRATEAMHEQDPLLARYVAQLFKEYVDELDRRAGLSSASLPGGVAEVCELIAHLSPAAAQLIVQLVNAIADGDVDEREKREIRRAEAALEAILGQLKAQIAGEANR
jgi:hypothetical protein